MTKVLVQVFGNTLNSHQTFLDHLTLSSNIKEVSTSQESDFIIAFVSIASRAGTDIEAALREIPVGQKVVLVVLHHNMDQYCVVADSRHAVHRRDVFTVDCLFHEDRGLLRCLRNDEALKAVKEHLESHGFRNESQIRGTSPSAGQSVINMVTVPVQQCLVPDRRCELVSWMCALVSICVFISLSLPNFVPWVLLLLAIPMERYGYGKWTPLTVFVVTLVFIVILSLVNTEGQESQRPKDLKV